MQLKPFALDMWLDDYARRVDFNLAASTGPEWTANGILDLAGEEERERYLHHTLTYGRAAGADGLRVAIAEMHAVDPECVQIVAGASEALLILFWIAAEPGANVILPQPGFPPFATLPQSLGLETRFYRIRRESAFQIDPAEIEALTDRNTKLVLVNTPHNPTGATMSDAAMERLHAFTASRGVVLVSDEVYHPIYHGAATQSAARLPNATVISDCSKAFPLAGTRTGWIVERDRTRLEAYKNARCHFSVSNNSAGEILAEIAVRARDKIWRRTQEVASRNLDTLEAFMADRRDTFGWIRPNGGMTAFPWLLSGEDARPFCRAAAEIGVLLAPGDCFDAPEHVRLGFAAEEHRFADALDRLASAAVNFA
ncbi:MAG TPA: aminotransferase class I/II-fold pyridoxal phosphate-dependent enzyme [Candidatus Baltobacteraceae bacterium]|jgi:aspartate/methionine/tyrosine aminotransferase|nr:aminotransferase class I/II-fold pyridoxal phosphate-dependent enzyme [Candidatus Baltobacteraceae bacterium]